MYKNKSGACNYRYAFLMLALVISENAQAYQLDQAMRADRPVFIRDRGDCDKYRSRAEASIQIAQDQHELCLKKNSRSTTMRETGTNACSIRECQGYHNQKALFVQEFDETFSKCQLRVMEIEADENAAMVKKQKREQEQMRRDSDRAAREAASEARFRKREQRIIDRLEKH